MKKVVLAILALTLFQAGALFAQQKEGYIKPTYSVGWALYEKANSSYNLVAQSVDVDFVTAAGLTIGLQQSLLFNGQTSIGTAAFGMGYTYTAERWSAGAKVMAIPAAEDNAGIGGDLNGSFWFSDRLGLSLLADYYIGLGTVEWSSLSVRLGISAKF